VWGRSVLRLRDSRARRSARRPAGSSLVSEEVLFASAFYVRCFRHNSEMGRFQTDWAFLGFLIVGVRLGVGSFTSLGSFGTVPRLSRSSNSRQACSPGF
jgi:hypothetical protein